ncbi:MAG: DUF1566 domain-containing protein [Ignavibacteria bacterium]|nr:DUF1566 domain-containing protein [Ignavibacteria bacterium]
MPDTKASDVNEQPSRGRKVLGWVAAGISTLLAGLWAFWGAIENFHEGWYSTSFLENLFIMIIQYAAPMLVFLILTSIALRFPLIGGILHIALGVGIAMFFRRGAGVFMIGVPLALLGLTYVFGRPRPLKRAYQIALGIPLLIYVGSAIEPAIRVAGRHDDGIRTARLVEGNGVRLIWAPEGPGWPSKGTRLEEAMHICAYLEEDGKSLSDTVQNIWRLPTIDEAVRSLTRHGTNCGGVWDADRQSATYETMPDKESPLWDIHSPIIYWWTATEKDSATVYRIVYNGGVHEMPKSLGMGSMAFRAVKPASD